MDMHDAGDEDAGLRTPVVPILRYTIDALLVSSFRELLQDSRQGGGGDDEADSEACCSLGTGLLLG